MLADRLRFVNIDSQLANRNLLQYNASGDAMRFMMQRRSTAVRGNGMIEKLNSMRLLDRLRVPYRIHPYDAAAAADAVAVAGLIGVDAQCVLKTLVTLPDDPRRAVLAMLPAPAQLDLKRLAASLGLKRLSMAPQRQAEHMTGLLVGGIGALALADKRWPAVIDASARTSETVFVSAGRRGVMLELAPADLQRVTAAVSADICLPGS